MEGESSGADARSTLHIKDLPNTIQHMSLPENNAHIQANDPQPIQQSMATTLPADRVYRHTQVLVSGISFAITDDHLINFLELMCHPEECEVLGHVQRGSKPGVAVVTFSSPVDLTKLQNACSQRPVERNTVLTVDPVDVCGTVVVCNPHPDTQTDSFKYYFQNRKHGGEKTARIERDPDNKHLVVYFSSKQVAHDVASKSHELEGRALDVVLFDINLEQLPFTSGTYLSGNPGGSTHTEEAPTLPTCSDIVSAVEGLTLSAEVDHDKDCQPKPLPKITVTVEGVHEVYLGVLDVFSEIIPRVMEDISMDVKGRIVELTGVKDAVEHAHRLLYNLIEKQKESPFLHSVPDCFDGWEQIFVQMEEQIGMRESHPQYLLLVTDGLASSGFVEEELCISCTQEDGQSLTFDEFLEKFVSLREESVCCHAESNLLCSAAWVHFLEGDFFQDFGNSVVASKNEDGTKVTLFGSVKCLAEAAGSVRRFLENVPFSKSLSMSSTQQSFLNTLKNKELITIQQCDPGLGKVKVEMKENALSIEGFRQGVNHAERSLKKIFDSLLCSRAIYSAEGLSKIEGTQEWNRMLDMVSKDCHCIISNLPDASVGDAGTDREEWGQWAATVVHSFSLSDAECHVVEGDVTVMKVDAIVMCHDSDAPALPVNPPTDRSTSNSAGARPKNNSQSHSKESAGIASGLTVKQPGALPCKAVIWVDLQRYLKSVGDDWLKVLMDDILQEAVDKGYSSLAVPVLGVDGIAKQPLPIAVATSVIAQSVTAWHERGSQMHGKESRLKNFCLCSNRSACIRGFIDAFENQELTPWPPSARSYSLLSREQGNSDKPPNMGTIRIMKGNVADIKTNVVVVPLDDDLDVNKNKVSRALQSCGGPSQYNLTHRSSIWSFKKVDAEYWEDTFAEERFLGSYGTSNAANIFYLYLPPWGPGVKEIMTKLLRRCLQEANKKGVKSLTLTALGVGKLSYPAEFSANTMLTVISVYLEQIQCSVDNVQIVIFPTDLETYKIFSREWSLQKAAHPAREVNSNQQLSYSPHLPTPTHHQTSVNRGRGGNKRGRRQGAGQQLRSSSARGRPSLRYENPYSPSVKCFDWGDVKVVVKQGNIVLETCDVIVNSTNEDFDLSRGGVSRTLLNYCGNELKELCNDPKKKKKMKKTGFALTPAPHLDAKQILHVDLHQFKLKAIDTLKKCLEMTRDYTNSAIGAPSIVLRSIAFPAFGTGEAAKGGEFPPMASALVKAVGEFKKCRHVKEVRLVVSSQEHFQQMSQAIEDMLSPKQSPQKDKEPANGKAAQEKETSSMPSGDASGKSAVVKRLCPLPNYHDPDAVSVYIFSDSPYERRKAEEVLASRIENMLVCNGLVATQTNPAPRSDGTNSQGASGGTAYSQGCICFGHPTYFYTMLW